MIFFDALVACLVLKIWSTDALMALAVTCMIAFLRVLPKLNRLLNIIDNSIVQVDYEKNEEDN